MGFAEVVSFPLQDLGELKPLPEPVRLKWLSLRDGGFAQTSGFNRALEQQQAALVVKQQELLARKLEVRLAAADAQRLARLAATTERARRDASRAVEVAAAQRALEAMEAARNLAALQDRLHRAELMRLEALTARQASQAERSPERFLQRRAVPRTALRRQVSSRRLQRSWRAFASQRRTTHALAAAFLDTGIPAKPVTKEVLGAPAMPAREARLTSDTNSSSRLGSPPRARTPPTLRARPGANGAVPAPQTPPQAPPLAVMGPRTRLLNADGSDRQEAVAVDPFEAFAAAIQSPATLAAAQHLLRRLETKVRITSATGDRCCAAALAALFPKAAAAGRPIDRYPVRIFLCAYMIQDHPETVFNSRTRREQALALAAAEMISAFESLLHHLALPADRAVRLGNSGSTKALHSTAPLLAAFDEGWVTYLEQFAAWKGADAASLEAELVRIAVELERSMLLKVGPDASRLQHSPDLQAMVEQVGHDHSLLKERILRLSGPQGVACLEAALTASRAAVAAELQAAAAAASNAAVATAHSNGASSPSALEAGMRPVTPSRPAPRRRAPADSPPHTPPLPAAYAPSGPSSRSENVGLVWELLYDANYQLPMAAVEQGWRDACGKSHVMQEAKLVPESLPPAELAAAVEFRIRRIADQAFWDSLSAELAANMGSPAAASAAARLAGLLGQIGADLVGVLPQGSAARAKLEALLDPERLLEALSGGQGAGLAGVDTGYLFQVLEATAQMLRELGAPAREAEALAAQGDIRKRLTAAAAAGNSGATASVAVAALRLLAAQLKLLRMDAANARLRFLARSLPAGAGIRYARDAFAAAHGLTARAAYTPMQLASALPATQSWLAAASECIAQVEPVLSQLHHPATPAVASALPATLRTGRGALAAVRTSAAASPLPAAELVLPAAPRSWQGLVRLGLIARVAGEAAENLPETLALDAARLHAATETFQRLVVTTACLGLLQQLLRQADPLRRLTPGEAAAAKARLAAVLADPGMRLPDLAAEVGSLARAGSRASSGGGDAAVQAALTRLLARDSPGFKAICKGLTAAVQLPLLAPASAPDVQAAVAASLVRCGAEAMRSDVVELAINLGQVAAISEAVHEQVYEQMCVDLL